jgi:D-alanine-D-alanine ligase
MKRFSHDWDRPALPGKAAGPTWRVAVLAGGDSAEREISLQSGAAVCAALHQAGHQTIAIDPAGRDLADIDWSRIDACFIALHGGAGEDGRVQHELDRLGVPYTGSGPEACRLAMSKSAAKRRFVECRVPTAPWIFVDADDARANLDARVAPLGYPLIVKPDAEGSSLGVALVETPSALQPAVDAAAAYGSRVLVEPRLHGREFTIALVGERALPIIEIVTPEPTFSYEAKYISSLTEHRFDFDLDTRTRVELLHAAVGAARAIGTRGLARVDLIAGRDGGARVLEVNTVPGLTPHSLAPLAAERAGWSMPVLCHGLLRECLAGVGVA